MTLRLILEFSLFIVLAVGHGAAEGQTQAQALQPRQLAIVVNDAEPNSVAIADYYRRRRAIPAANVCTCASPAGRARSSRRAFAC
jgi:hypothetical protein